MKTVNTNGRGSFLLTATIRFADFVVRGFITNTRWSPSPHLGIVVVIMLFPSVERLATVLSAPETGFYQLKASDKTEI